MAAVVAEQFLGGGKQRLVYVLGGADLAQEVGQIVALGETGELRDVVQTYVDQARDAGVLQPSEELGRGFARKTDRTDLHVSSTGELKRASCPSCAGASGGAY